jgi:hypothetical protein
MTYDVAEITKRIQADRKRKALARIAMLLLQHPEGLTTYELDMLGCGSKSKDHKSRAARIRVWCEALKKLGIVASTIEPGFVPVTVDSVNGFHGAVKKHHYRYRIHPRLISA